MPAKWRAAQIILNPQYVNKCIFFFGGQGSARAEGLPPANVQLVMAYGVAIKA